MTVVAISGLSANQIIDSLLGDEFKLLGRQCPSEKKQKKWDRIFNQFTYKLNTLICRVRNGDLVDEGLFRK